MKETNMGFSHIELNVSTMENSVAFYLNVLAPLGFMRADSEPDEYTRLTNGRDAVIVLCPVEDRFRERGYHRKAIGLHHFAIVVGTSAELDCMEEHLRTIDVPLRGEGRTASDYRGGYDSLFIEDPDRILIEIVYHGDHYFAASDGGLPSNAEL
jgi:catechol-2,3-dioxygenase